MMENNSQTLAQMNEVKMNDRGKRTTSCLDQLLLVLYIYIYIYISISVYAYFYVADALKIPLD